MPDSIDLVSLQNSSTTGTSSPIPQASKIEHLECLTPVLHKRIQQEEHISNKFFLLDASKPGIYYRVLNIHYQVLLENNYKSKAGIAHRRATVVPEADQFLLQIQKWKSQEYSDAGSTLAGNNVAIL